MIILAWGGKDFTSWEDEERVYVAATSIDIREEVKVMRRHSILAKEINFFRDDGVHHWETRL